MTRFVFQGSGHTTGGSGPLGAVAAVVVIGAVGYAALKPAAAALGDLLVIVPVAVGSLLVGAVVTFAVVRARGRRRTAPRQPVQLWHANPQAILAAPRRAIEAPAQPVVNVNIDAGLLAGLLREAQRQQAPVVAQAEHEELPR